MADESSFGRWAGSLVCNLTLSHLPSALAASANDLLFSGVIHSFYVITTHLSFE